MLFSGQITQLTIYPVKAFAGIALSAARVTPMGLEGDREWMLVNTQGRFVTQRGLPRLAAIAPGLRNGDVWLQAPQLGEVRLAPPPVDAEPVQVRVWKDTCLAQAADGATNTWVTQAAQSSEPLRLVKLAPGFVRAANIARFGEGSHTQFADAAPYLMGHEASLVALNLALQAAGEAPVDSRRFRANVTVGGGEAFAEHHWSSLRTEGGVVWGLKDHCQRCSVITVDPDLGTFSPRALAFGILAGLNAMPNNSQAPAFGVNAVLQAGEGAWVRVGEAVWVTD